MTPEMQVAIVGVAGTVIGTVLGWLLNNFSQRGKLNCYVVSWKDEFKRNGEEEITNLDIAQTETQLYSYSFSLDIYNSCASTKIMRGIEVVFMKGKDELKVDIPFNEATKRTTQHLTFYDKITPINIPPKAVAKLNLQNYFWKSEQSIDFIWNSTKVYLRYIDENNKKRKILLNTDLYSNHFNKLTLEENEDGQA